jgi:FPC/CPF motif-containing protein YcgG
VFTNLTEISPANDTRKAVSSCSVQPPSNAAKPASRDDDIKKQFAAFVAAAEFPCLGAKAAFNAGIPPVSVFDSLGSAKSSRRLAAELGSFVQSQRTRPSRYATFVAIFREPRSLGERDFERRLWRQLQQLHEIDVAAHNEWDESVASDPSDPRFSFSFAGQALYVVGLHGGSSRLARRFPWPALGFNPHEQFERLRHDGKRRRMQAAIRNRDVALQGSVNPMLSDFGEQSEARQYSGRAVEDTWEAPFRASPHDRTDKAAPRCPFAH